MKKIITVQHTESVHHLNGMVGSWMDWELSDAGREQAYNIGMNLKKKLGDKKYVLYSSDLKRASETAKIVGNILGTEPILRWELRERNLGRCCGRSVRWLKENSEMHERFVDDRCFSDAESRRDEWIRLRLFFDEIIDSDEENIMIVSHGDLLSVFNTMCLGLNVEALNDFELFGYSGGVSSMYIDDEGKRFIKTLSDLEYLSKQGL